MLVRQRAEIGVPMTVPALAEPTRLPSVRSLIPFMRSKPSPIKLLALFESSVPAMSPGV